MRGRECQVYKRPCTDLERPLGDGRGVGTKAWITVAVISVIGVALLALLGFSGALGRLATAILNGSNGAPIGQGSVSASESEVGDTGESEAQEEKSETDEDGSEKGDIENETSDPISGTEGASEESATPPQWDEDVRVTLDVSDSLKGEDYLINYSGESIDVEGILEQGFDSGRQSYSELPLVMIIHTHTSEMYYDYSVDTPTSSITKSVIAVGEALAYQLNQNGISTVHCTVIHDGDGGENPYAAAEKTIATMLKIYPSIEYVIDLHRMEISDGEGREVRTLSSLDTAQIRLTVSSEGVLPRDSVALALALRRELNSGSSRLCMPVVYTDSRYNSHLVPYYLKVDVGARGNSTDEAVSAARLLAAGIEKVLKK